MEIWAGLTQSVMIPQVGSAGRTRTTGRHAAVWVGLQYVARIPDSGAAMPVVTDAC